MLSAGGVAGAEDAVAPMPGVVEKVAVSPGMEVQKGDPLVVMIAMKMEVKLPVLGLIVCLFVLRLNIPVNNFESCREGATVSWVLPVLLGSKVSCSRTHHGGGRF